MNTEHISKTYEYFISGDDVIEYVDSNWTEFAVENSGASLVPDNIIGTSIWNYITDDTTISIYQSVFHKVRHAGVAIELPFRCDSPGTRRYMRLEVEPMDNKHLRLNSNLIREEPRRFIHILSNYFKHGGMVITMCSWCKKIRIDDGSWVEIETALDTLKPFHNEALPSISHGICQHCHFRVWPKFH